VPTFEFYMTEPLGRDGLITNAHRVGVQVEQRDDGHLDLTCSRCGCQYSIGADEAANVGAVICPGNKCNRPKTPAGAQEWARHLSVAPAGG